MHVMRRLLASPGRVLVCSIILMIALGTLLLSLPICLKIPGSLSWLDLLFTSTSATCVTGLLSISFESFTIWGKFIILLLMQIGGIGLITFTVFFISLFIDIGFGTQLMAGQLLEIDRYQTSRHMIGFIIFFSLCLEIIGALCIFFVLPNTLAVPQRIFQSVFHAISSFCSAGFVIFPQGIESFASNIPFLLITTSLMLIGELGFIVWHDLLLYGVAWYKKKPFRFSLHTKIVLHVTGTLICASSIVIWLLERKHALAQFSWPLSIVNVLFNAISYRSSGFTTIDVTTVHLATLFLIMIIAFIGSSPGSTGSGIKTTTFAIFLAAIRAVTSGRTVVEIKNRTIANDQVFKAMSVLSVSLSWLALVTFCLLITEEGWRFADIMLEAFSAFANLGLSNELTPDLSIIGKLIVIISMMAGRIGSLTLILAFKRKSDRIEFHYPQERILIS